MSSADAGITLPAAIAPTMPLVVVAERIASSFQGGHYFLQLEAALTQLTRLAKTVREIRTLLSESNRSA
jgi:hypothetical protein